MLTHFIRYTATILIVVLLHACGGGSTSSSPTATVSGVAATGAAIDGTVTLKDSTGITRSAVISLPSGAFSMDVSGLTPPYFLKATNNAGTLTLYSIATGSGTFNINPLSNLVVVAAAMSIDPLAKTPDAAFNNPAHFSTMTVAQIQAATDSVMAQMSPAFKSALADYGVTNVNPLTDSFQIGNGLDKVFDGFVITLNTATGEVQEYQVCGQTSASAGSTTTPPAGTLIITANPVCKSYDSMAYSGGNGVNYNGFLNGDNPAVLGGTLTYGGTSQGARNAGTYTITPGGMTSSNYNIIFVDSTLTIKPLSIPVTVNNTTKIYDGSTTIGGLVAGSGITLSSANAGTYGFISGDALSSGASIVPVGTVTTTGSITLSSVNYVISGGTLAVANYGLTTTGATTATISAAALSAGP